MRTCFQTSIIGFAALALVAGCGGSGDGLARQSVSGKVTLDGKPLEAGSIQFLPADTGTGSVMGGTVIKGGAYEIGSAMGLTPGKYKVTISSAAGDAAVDAGAAPGPAAKPPKELIPGKYNVESTLTAEVKASGGNTFDFELASK